MVPMILVCAAVTAAALFYVFQPLIFMRADSLAFDRESSRTALGLLLRKKETVYENIKDLEFEFKMGKLSEEDFQRLRNDLSREAYEILTQIDTIKPQNLDKSGQSKVVAVLKSDPTSKK